MVIRPEQMASMDEAMQNRYHEELRKLLREQSPDLVAKLDDATLLERIAAAVGRARGYGVQTGEGILAYVGLSLAAGAKFDDDPKIQPFLRRPGEDPDAKIHWLFTRILESLQPMVEAVEAPKLR
jgi:hypothetical protein